MLIKIAVVSEIYQAPLLSIKSYRVQNKTKSSDFTIDQLLQSILDHKVEVRLSDGHLASFRMGQYRVNDQTPQ